jgi:hypothetical protein
LIFKTQPASKGKNKSTFDIECLDANDAEEEGFSEGDVVTGKVVSTFNFGMSNTSSDSNTSNMQFPLQKAVDEKFNIQNETYTTTPRGLTPPINGENFTVKRSYTMRPSTVRKLNALKAEHPDVNVLFNTIVDMAISHYYNYIFNAKEIFSAEEENKINS